MASKNLTTQQFNDYLNKGCDCTNCQMRMVGDTDLVECLMKMTNCQWALPFGEARYCQNPTSKQIAISNQV